MRRWTVFALAALALAGPAGADEPPPAYAITDLGNGFGLGISNATSPHVVGRDSSTATSFLWQGGTRTAIDRGLALYTYVSGVNDAGNVAGTSYVFDYATSSWIPTAFRWDAAGGFQDIASGALAFGINDSDAVVGESAGRATLWEGATATDLGVLSGDVTSTANGINNAGQVVGASRSAGFATSRAFLWDAAGGMVDLGVDNSSVAYAVNDAVQVVGSSGHGAFLWEGGLVTQLGDLDGDGDGISSGYASAINNLGQVVGSSPTGAFVYYPGYYGYYGGYSPFWVAVVHATLWQDGAPVDLNSLIPAGAGWELLAARGINDAGQIVGWGTLGGAYRAFLLTLPSAVPAAPTGLAATPAIGRVSLVWNGSVGAFSYEVKRAPAAGGPYVLIASGLHATGFTDTGLSDGTAYSYVVAARNSFGVSPDTAPVTVTTPAPPSAPTNLVAVSKKVKGERRVTLGWTQSTSPNLASNIIYRSTTKGGPYLWIGQVSPSTQYVDPLKVSDHATYYYRVAAVNNFGQLGALSSEAAAVK